MTLSNIPFKKTLLSTLLFTVSSSYALANDTTALEQRVKKLEQQLAQQSKQQSKLDTPSDMTAKFYATIRPSLTYSDKGDDNSVDVTDFLSFAGFYTDAQLGDGWSAYANGEWALDIAKDGDFGASRRATVGVKTPYGTVAFGKDRAIDYLLHATHVDIFNHRASPFAYDQIGKDAFFTANQVTYSNTWSDVTLMAGFKFDSRDDSDYAEQSIVGLGYDANDLHLALSYKSTKALIGDSIDTLALSYAQQINDTLYLAAMYQDEEDINTFDLSLGYKINDKYKFKGGYFRFDDGISNGSSQDNDGFNLTLERRFTPAFQTHIEVLTKSYDNQENEVALAVGFKYDFAILWKS